MKYRNDITTILCALFLFLFVTSSIKSCELNKELKSLEKGIISKERTIEEREEVIRKIEDKIKDSENKVAELKETVKKREKEIEDFKRKYQEQKSKIKEFTHSDYEKFYEERYSTSPEDVKSTETELSLSYNVVEKVTEDIIERDYLEEENGTLKNIISDKDSIINEKDNIISDKDSVIEEKDKTLADERDIKKMLNDSIEAYKKENSNQKKKTFWSTITAGTLGILTGIIISK